MAFLFILLIFLRAEVLLLKLNSSDIIMHHVFIYLRNLCLTHGQRFSVTIWRSFIVLILKFRSTVSLKVFIYDMNYGQSLFYCIWCLITLESFVEKTSLFSFVV
jgi:hypothetical protein